MTDSPALPLANLRVLEFTHAVMGPTAGLVLGDLGAEVIHVEPPDGDATRRLKGFGTGYFPFYNRNKRSLALDIKSPEGRKIIRELIPSTDIVVENFGPGTMERLGFGYEELRALNARLLYLSLKGFLSGPYEKRAAMDEVVQMMGGLAYMTGPPGQPLRAGTSIIDIGGGLFGSLGLALALYEREKTGQGKFIQASLFETTAFFMGQHMAYSALTDGPIPPMPSRVSAWSVYRTFECQDGEQIFLGVISDRHWGRFCEAFNRPDWAQDPRLTTNNGRIDQRSWLMPELEALLAQHTKVEILARCDAAGVPCAPIARPEDLFDDPQLNQARSGVGLLETTLPDGTRTRLPRLPLQYGASDLRLRRDPPPVGDANDGLLRELGYGDDAIRALRAEGTIAPDVQAQAQASTNAQGRDR